MKEISITPEQRRKWEKEGKELLDENVVTGFQLEDFDPHPPKKSLYYAHTNPFHLSLIQRNIGGRRFPRESIYRWDKIWGKPSQNTVLINHGQYAKEKGEYIQTRPNEANRRFLHRKAIRRNKHYKDSVMGSWYVPDIRIFGVSSAPHYKKAYLVTKNIDRDSRFATVITRKDKLRQLRRELHGERVRRILIQDEKPKKKHSLWTFINGITPYWNKKKRK